ncbi:MAG: hypothetical protein M5U30_08890 [Burkholderiaceae bacterium]|nr:hypothetical protein [Burkholderiaceae bacterium]
MIARALSLAALAVLLAALGACGPIAPVTPTPAPRPTPTPTAPPAPTTVPARPVPSRPGPIADRPINLDGYCNETEEDGFHENARLVVRDNQVQQLSWQMQIGRRGSCSFELASFRQTRSRPHVELAERDGKGCKLMIWQDPRRITMGHAGCEKHCTPGVYDKAWPVMFDPGTGGCARP